MPRISSEARRAKMRNNATRGAELDEQEEQNIHGTWERKGVRVRCLVLNAKYGAYAPKTAKDSPTPNGFFLYVVQEILHVDPKLGVIAADGQSAEITHEVHPWKDGKELKKLAVDESRKSTIYVGDVLRTNTIFPSDSTLTKHDGMITTVHPKHLLNDPKDPNSGFRRTIDPHTGLDVPRVYWEQNKSMKRPDTKSSLTDTFNGFRDIPVSRRMFGDASSFGSFIGVPMVAHVNMTDAEEVDEETGMVLVCNGVRQCFKGWKLDATDTKPAMKKASWFVTFSQYSRDDLDDPGHTIFAKFTVSFDETLGYAIGVFDPTTWASGIGQQIITNCPMTIIGNEGGNDQVDYALTNEKRQKALRDEGEVDPLSTHRSIHVEVNQLAADMAGCYRKCGTALTKDDVGQFSDAMFARPTPFAGAHQTRATQFPSPQDVIVLSEMSAHAARSEINSGLYDFFVLTNDTELKGDVAASIAKVKRKLSKVSGSSCGNFSFVLVGVHKRTSPEARAVADAKRTKTKKTRALAIAAVAGISASDLLGGEDEEEEKSPAPSEVEAADKVDVAEEAEDGSDFDIDAIEGSDTDDDGAMEVEDADDKKRKRDDDADADTPKKKKRKKGGRRKSKK